MSAVMQKVNLTTATLSGFGGTLWAEDNIVAINLR